MSAFLIVVAVLVMVLCTLVFAYFYERDSGSPEYERLRVATEELQTEIAKPLLPILQRTATQLDSWLAKAKR